MQFARSRRDAKAVCTAFLLLMVLWGLMSTSIARADGDLIITLIDIGQGDSTLIQSPSGQSLLFDGGKNGRGNSIVIPFLQSVGIDTLDFMVASHYHDDHIGGLDEVINAIPVRKAVYDRGWEYGTLTYTSYANAVADKRQTIEPGQVIDLGAGVLVTCVALNGNNQLSPPFTSSTKENEYDVCLLVEYGGFDYFQAGDLTGGNTSSYTDIETSVAPLVGDVDVYHVSHHGSYSSSNPNFLQTVQAEVSVISVGDNGYGHPHQVVLDRLVQYGSFVYQTETGDGGTLPAQDLRVVGGHVAIVTDGLTHYTVDGDLWEIDESISGAESTPAVAFQIRGNFPNPFNPSTEIIFESANSGPSRLTVYDVAGRLVYSNHFTATSGRNSIAWQGRNNRGITAPGGVYLYLIESPSGRGSGRMLMLK